MDEDIDTLRARQYKVVVYDQNGATVSRSITLTEPSDLSITLVADTFHIGSSTYNLSCFDCSNGRIVATVSGGVPGYQYIWSTGQTTSTISNLTSGLYAVMVTDANGAKRKESVFLKALDRTDWSITGNSSSDSSSNFIGTVDNKPLIFKTNNIERIKINSSGMINLHGDVKIDSASTDSVNAIYADQHGILRKGPIGGAFNGNCIVPSLAFYRNVCTNDGNYYFIGGTNSAKLVVGQMPSVPGNYKLYVSDGILTEKIRVADKNGSYWSDFVFESNYKLTSLAQLRKFIIKEKHLPGIPTQQDVNRNGIDLAEMQAKLLQKIEELTLYIIELNDKYEALKKSLNK